MSRRLLIPLLALVLTISGLLVVAAWNRGVTQGRLTLTERELTLPWQWQHGTDDEAGDLQLSIEWQRRDDPIDERAWLTDDKLRDIGFDVHIPPGAPEAERRYRQAIPRIGWVVFEYDGPAWQVIEQRRQLRADASMPKPAVGPSRLVPIDAGKDREVLARRHAAAQVLILPAVLQMVWLPAGSGGPMAYGVVQRLAVQEVTIPRRLRGPLEPFRAQRQGLTPKPETLVQPRYEVDLAVGRLGLPWVTGLRPAH
jgi:hypothetical protein